MTGRTGKIGIFDSGFGGLSIARSVMDKLPGYDYVYLGDSANAPYGPRPASTVRRLTERAVDTLFGMGCDLIIIACNTASALGLSHIQEGYLPKKWPEKRVLGVLIPAAEAAVELGYERVGVMATIGTVNSGSIPDEIHKLSPEVQVFQQACPELVPLIEAGDRESDDLQAAITRYGKVLQDQQVEAVILGCTHYGLIEDAIRYRIPDIHVINEGPVVADKLSVYLREHPELEKKLSKNSTKEFYSTDTDTFNVYASDFFGGPVNAQFLHQS